MLTLVIGLVIAGCAAPAPAPAEKPIRVTFATIGIRTDYSWSQSIYEAYLYIKEKYPEFDVTFRDEIPWGDFPVYLEMQEEFALSYTTVEGEGD